MATADDLPVSGRIACLDHIRGLSILGILLVNAIAFAQPMDVYSNPALSIMPLSHADNSVWWLTEVFFREKFVTLFSMLFGISLFLVGREQGEGVFGTPLFRRLAWLVIFGLIHGALIWHGDILLAYAFTGFFFWKWRHADARRLIGWGVILFLAGAAILLLPIIGSGGQSPITDNITAIDTTMRSGFLGSLSGNFHEWSTTIIPELIDFLPTTLGLMLMGLGLFKAGVLSGQATTRTYIILMVAGAVSLVAIAFQSSQSLASHFAYPQSYGLYQIANTVLCVPVSLAYASALILMGRTGLGRFLLYPLACCGRMAFTNYLTQSIVMTMIFYGGRSFGGPLFGEDNATALVPIVVTVWMAQLIVSPLWLSVFRYGPFEWVWRCLTYNRVMPMFRGS